LTPEAFIIDNVESLSFLGPEIVLSAGCLLILMAGVAIPYWRFRMVFTVLGVAALGGSLLALTALPLPGANVSYLSHLFVWDWLNFFFKPFFAVAGGVTVLLIHGSREIDDQHYHESVFLVLAVTTAMMLLVAATDLLMIYLAFETMGILSYLLVGIKAHDLRSGEAALKYVLYGAFTSGIMLFGFSLIFGIAGTTGLSAISQAVASAAAQSQGRLLLVLAMLFFMAGLLFKAASFPFHFWCPDVYEGAPTPVTAFLSVGPKAAAFALFIRLFYPLFATPEGTDLYAAVTGLDWPVILALISAVTMTLGNVAALPQTNVKRLLAYSSIAHAGYLLMGLACLSSLGLRAVVFYLGVYLFMNLGAFAVVAILGGTSESEEIHFYRGLGNKAPFIAVAMAVFMFSLIGLPPFSGFVGKVYLFAAVISRKIYWLAVVAALNTVVSLYYYMRVVKAMFLESAAEARCPVVTPGSQVLLVVLLIPTLGLGIYWQPLAQIVGLMFR
jgi:NADH-quinone oxidoreductase subunit N